MIFLDKPGNVFLLKEVSSDIKSSWQYQEKLDLDIPGYEALEKALLVEWQ